MRCQRRLTIQALLFNGAFFFYLLLHNRGLHFIWSSKLQPTLSLSPFQAYVELIERFGWKTFTILYEDNEGLVRLQELLKSPTQSDVRVVVRQLPADDDYRFCYHLLPARRENEVKTLHNLPLCSFKTAAQRRQEVRRDPHRLGLFHGEDPVRAEAGAAGGDDDGLPQLPHH